jgi:serine/threonine protein kinase
MSKSKSSTKQTKLGELLAHEVFEDIVSQTDDVEPADVELYEIEQTVHRQIEPDDLDLQSDCSLYGEDYPRDQSSDSESGSESAGDEESDDDEMEFTDDVDSEYLSDVIHLFADDYRVVKTLANTIGRHVYKCVELRTQELKVITISQNLYDYLMKDQDDIPREIQIMMHLKGIPGFAQLEAWGPLEFHCYFFITPFYPGIDLLTCGKDRSLMAKVMLSLFEGINELQEQGISHRDICPGNIIINPLTSPMVTIIDFDKSCWSRPTGYHHTVGQQDYFAPEKIRTWKDMRAYRKDLKGERTKDLPKPERLTAYDDRADIYSCGVMLMSMLTNDYPEPGPSLPSNDESVAAAKKVPLIHSDVAKFIKQNRQTREVEFDLCLRLLDDDLSKRLTLEQAIEHPFFNLTDKSLTKEYTVFQDTIAALGTQRKQDQEDEQKEMKEDSKETDDDDTDEVDLDEYSRSLEDEDEDEDDDEDVVERKVASEEKTPIISGTSSFPSPIPPPPTSSATPSVFIITNPFPAGVRESGLVIEELE